MSDDAEKSSRRGAPKLKLTPRPVSKGELIAQGREAATLLSSTVYNVAVQSCVQHLQDEWLNEADPAKREGIWHRAQALGAVQLDLLDFVKEAQRLTEAALREEEASAAQSREASGF